MKSIGRVGILSPFPRNATGGVATFSRNLKVAFERRPGLSCTLATPLFGTLSVSRRPLATCGSLFGLLLHLIERRPHAVFVQGHAALIIPAIVYARLFFEPVVVFTFHTEWSGLPESKVPVVRWLLKQCTAVTFVSNHLSERMIQRLLLPSDCCRVVLPGVVVDASPPAESARIARVVDGRRPVLSYIGAMTWQEKVEGLKILISALGEVRQLWPDVLLLVAGTGDFADEVRQFCINKGLERHVAFLGSVQSPEACLRFSNLYVHITLRESLGLAILEAMASGVPVIASDTGAAREIVTDGKTGLLVQPEIRSVSSGICWLLSHPEAAQAMARAGQDSVLKRFSWDRTAEEYVRLAETCPRVRAF